MATKAEMAKEMTKLLGKEVNPADYDHAGLEKALREAKAAEGGEADAAAQADSPATQDAPSQETSAAGTSNMSEDTSSSSANTSDSSEDTSNAQNSSQSDEGKVSAYLGASSPAGRLVLGGVTLRRLRANEDPESAAVTITREQLEQYGEDYDIKVVEG